MMATSIPPTFSAKTATRQLELAPPKDNELIMFGEEGHGQEEAEQDSDESGDELSEEQIVSLLQQASTRLQQKASAGATAAADIDPESIRFPKLNPGPLPKPYIHTTGGVSRIIKSAAVITASAPLSITDPVPVVKKKNPNAEPPTAGSQWFDLPLTSKDPQTLRDIQLIQMREALDPHRHYKKNIMKTVPKYSQMGTIVVDHSEYYSGRLTNKERKNTILEEVMSSQDTLDRLKRKRNEQQEKSRAGGREHYKRLKERRKRK